VHHQQQFHQVALHRLAGRLDHENVGAAHVFLDLQVDSPSANCRTVHAPSACQASADLLRQRRIGVAGEDCRRS
jgi:hypothetical protein